MSEFYPQDDDLDFWADPGAQQAEAADSPEETPAEEVVAEAPAEVTEADTVEEAPADERPRDEQGRFVSQKEEEPEVEAAPDDPAALKAELDALQRRLADKDEFIGRQSSEVGELRRALEERMAGIEQSLSRPQAPSSWDDLIEENPAQAVQLAYQHGDEYQLRRAAQAWEEVSPGSPAVWAENIRLRAEMEQRLSQIEQRTQPVVQQTEDQARARAYLNVKNKHPDIEQQIDSMRQIAASFPIAVKAIESGTPEEAEQGWETLYSLAKAGQADTLQQTAQQVARNALEGEQRAREEAVVASASSVKTEAPKKSAADLIAEEWEALEKPLSDGWNLG